MIFRSSVCAPCRSTKACQATTSRSRWRQEQQGGPTFRKVLPFTAYMEGWALYAEWLGSELGVYQNDPFSDLGRLQGEMFRAVRWWWTPASTPSAGRASKPSPTCRPHRHPRREVTARSSATSSTPGQACAYKVGMLAIRAARERSEKALGAKWNAEAEKAFHDVVLKGGALPLAILDEQVDEWIKSRDVGR